MKPSLYYLLILSLLFFFSPLSGQHRKPVAGKEPSWVTINQYNYTESSLENETEDGYMDMVYENQLSVGEQSFYCRKVIKILTEAGIQNSSEVSVNFDPSYQQLTFHTIRIHRGNEIINQLNISKIKTIQQEKELNRFLYNGSLTSVLFLEDIRKGDLVEYSYTIKGANPVFKGKFATSFDMGYTVPIGNLYYKLVVPKQKTITIKNNGTRIEPVIKELPLETIYVWKSENVSPLRVDDGIPSWYDPFAMVMISEYQNWQEVNDWAMDLFPVVIEKSAALQKKIREIAAVNNTPEQRTLAALRFVQDDIRYMGIEMGQSSHRPNNPNKILAQRFGDCKDKTYLLCTILRDMGIEACPVLINTTYKKTIREWLPSPKIFDHVTVRVKLGNRYYWFDPTISLQRGDIDHISYPDYQYGLVVGEGTRSLTSIKVKEPGMVKVKEVFDIKDMSGKARLTVLTHYSGSFADDMRYSFSNTSKYEMQKSFRGFYASFYEEIIADSLTYSDDARTGILTTKEYYSIDSLWTVKDGIKKTYFQPFVIDGIIKKPNETKRSMPFSLTFPARYKEDIEINLPGEWKVEESTDKVETDYFFMRGKFSYAGNKVLIAYEYEALQDHVPPGGAKEFIEGLKSKDNNFNYFLSNPENNNSFSTSASASPEKSNKPLYSSLLVLLLVGGIFWWIQKKG